MLWATFHRSSLGETVFVRLAPFHIFISVVIWMIVKIAISSYVNSGTDPPSDRKLSEWEYVDKVVLLSKEPNKLNVIHYRLDNSVDISQICFINSKCKMLLQGWSGPKPRNWRGHINFVFSWVQSRGPSQPRKRSQPAGIMTKILVQWGREFSFRKINYSI